MRRPGDRLRALCARVCGAKTMARLIDPVLSDLQAEYQDARRRGQVWRSRWIRAAGYGAFMKVVAIHGCERATRATRTLIEWPADDRRALGRTIGFFAAGMAAVTCLFVSPALRVMPRGVALYLIPQGLPFAMPLGVTLGIFCGLGGRAVSSRLKGAVLAMALACCVASCAAMVWIVPPAGRAMRVAIAEHTGLAREAYVDTPAGLNEATLTDLRQRIDSLTHAGRERDTRKLALAYHSRWAQPCAAFALALFALSVMPRRPVWRGVLPAAACAAWLAYFLLLALGTIAARQGALPVVAVVWAPNLVFALAPAAWRGGLRS
jgi:hypothetical protein